LADIFQTVASIVAEFDLEQQGYRLVTNGGAYQDVQQLHFHLISGGAID
jgi:diadenosine tetraphosphate (Ap4A) HIT family hydrolase